MCALFNKTFNVLFFESLPLTKFYSNIERLWDCRHTTFKSINVSLTTKFNRALTPPPLLNLCARVSRQYCQIAKSKDFFFPFNQKIKAFDRTYETGFLYTWRPHINFKRPVCDVLSCKVRSGDSTLSHDGIVQFQSASILLTALGKQNSCPALRRH